MKLQTHQQPSVATQLSQRLKIDQNHRRGMLLKLLTSVKLLARQGLAIRGHVENEGKLIQLLLCRPEDVRGLN